MAANGKPWSSNTRPEDMASLDRTFGMDRAFNENPVDSGNGFVHASLGDGCSCSCPPKPIDLCQALEKSAVREVEED